MVAWILPRFGQGVATGPTPASETIRMNTRAIVMLILALGPAAGVYFSGHSEPAHYLGLGALLAIQLGLLARPVAAFAFLLPLVYAAAAITAQSTDGVVALVVAIAAAIGASSSQGFHRGLVALLAAALMGSFEASQAAEVVQRAAWIAGGATYGYLLAITVLRRVSLEARAVDAPTALGYAALLACLALIAWFGARIGGFPHAWWLPLVVVVVSDPLLRVSTAHSLLRLVVALGGSLLLVGLVDAFDEPSVRGLLLVVVLFATFAGLRRHPWVVSIMFTPALVLLSSHGALHDPPIDYLLATLPAFLAVCAASCLGHFVLWTLRSDGRRVTA